MRSFYLLYAAAGLLFLSPGLLAQDFPDGGSFRRGDANADGSVNISDSTSTFGWLFLGGDPPVCLDAADSNDDGEIDIADGIYTLNFLFVGGVAPPYPGLGRCDVDPTDDALGCERFPPCTCGGFVGAPCAEGEVCDLPPGLCSAADMQGRCVPLREGCPEIYDPVCGCDGVTYSNDCERIRAGMTKDRDGPCGEVRLDPPAE